MQRAPFRSIFVFCQELLRLSLHFPGLQALFAFSELCLTQLPYNIVAPVSGDPEAIDVNVNINIEAPFDVHSQIGCRDGLPQCRCWSDRGEEGQNDLERLSRLWIRGRSWDEVGQVCGRSIVLGSEECWI